MPQISTKSASNTLLLDEIQMDPTTLSIFTWISSNKRSSVRGSVANRPHGAFSLLKFIWKGLVNQGH